MPFMTGMRSWRCWRRFGDHTLALVVPPTLAGVWVRRVWRADMPLLVPSAGLRNARERSRTLRRAIGPEAGGSCVGSPDLTRQQIPDLVGHLLQQRPFSRHADSDRCGGWDLDVQMSTTAVVAACDPAGGGVGGAGAGVAVRWGVIPTYVCSQSAGHG